MPEEWFVSPGEEEIRLIRSIRAVAAEQDQQWVAAAHRVIDVEGVINAQARHHLGFVREIAGFVLAKSGDENLASEIVQTFGNYRRRYLRGTDENNTEATR